MHASCDSLNVNHKSSLSSRMVSSFSSFKEKQQQLMREGSDKVKGANESWNLLEKDNSLDDELNTNLSFQAKFRHIDTSQLSQPSSDEAFSSSTSNTSTGTCDNAILVKKGQEQEEEEGHKEGEKLQIGDHDDDDDDDYDYVAAAGIAKGSNVLGKTRAEVGFSLVAQVGLDLDSRELKREKCVRKSVVSLEESFSLKNNEERIREEENFEEEKKKQNERRVLSSLIQNSFDLRRGGEGKKKLLTKQLVQRQLHSLNSVIFSKVKLLFLLISFLLLSFGNELTLIENVEAGFWTFYFPNLLKPSGFKELTDMIDTREMEMNSIKDNYSDNKYFWNLMVNMDEILNANAETNFQIYPEESVCSEIFPMFRKMAIEYSEIDYEHYMTPLQKHYDLLIQLRSKWFPEGDKSKNILPRQWEQELYERDLLIQIEWAQKLASNEEFKEKRRRMVEMFNQVKRSLDTSLPCVLLKYAFRQVSEDINQLALEMNINAMNGALGMVRSAYKRIEKFRESDQIAIDAILDGIKKEEIQVNN